MSRSTGDQDVDYYIEQLREEAQQTPEAMRRAVIRKAKQSIRTFNWNKTPDDPDGFNYRPTSFAKRYETRDAPVAGTNARPSELGGFGGFANVDSESRLRERIAKMKDAQVQ